MPGDPRRDLPAPRDGSADGPGRGRCRGGSRTDRLSPAPRGRPPQSAFALWGPRPGTVGVVPRTGLLCPDCDHPRRRTLRARAIMSRAWTRPPPTRIKPRPDAPGLGVSFPRPVIHGEYRCDPTHERYRTTSYRPWEDPPKKL